MRALEIITRKLKEATNRLVILLWEGGANENVVEGSVGNRVGAADSGVHSVHELLPRAMALTQ